MCTAVLPLFLVAANFGPGALGFIEGFADFVSSLAKLFGGVFGHYVERKKPWAALGYLVTTVATGSIAFAVRLSELIIARSIAWFGRGFRGPLRDFLLADAVEKTHFGRAYGLERAGDMLGAVCGPLVAAGLLLFGLSFHAVILITFLPGLLSAGSMFFLVQEKGGSKGEFHKQMPNLPQSSRRGIPKFPWVFWWLIVGVLLFGLGDFSRTFLILLAAQAVGFDVAAKSGVLSLVVILYALHNLISAVAAYPAGFCGDRWPKIWVLIVGYLLGVCTNCLLAGFSASFEILIVVFVLSGVYIAIEESIERATVAEQLPRELRSLGLGILAAVNAVGDLGASLYVGLLLEAGQPVWAFGIAAFLGVLGVAWLSVTAIMLRATGRKPT